MRAVPRGGYEPLAPGWPGDPRHRRGGPGQPGRDRRPRHRRGHRALRRASSTDLPQPPDPHRPLLRRHDRRRSCSARTRRRRASRSTRPRSRACCRCRCRHCSSTLPVFRNPANKHHAVSLTAEQFRYSFGNARREEESNELYERWTIPAPGRPLFEAAAANFNAALAGQGRHRQREPRPAAADHGRPGPHRPGGDHQVPPSSSTGTPTP